MLKTKKSQRVAIQRMFFKDLEVNANELAKRALYVCFWGKSNGGGGLDSAGNISIRTHSLNSCMILMKINP